VKRLDQLHGHVPGQVVAALVIVPAAVFHSDLGSKTRLSTVTTTCDMVPPSAQSKGDCTIIHRALDSLDH
jgi:hypothetical protein